MNANVIRETIQKSLTGTAKFPEIVGSLIQEGVESYHVDLLRLENRYYSTKGETQLESLPLPSKAAAKTFSASLVKDAVRKSQAGQIDYKQFIDEILDAGTVGYTAYLSGKKVIYFGREGDFHIEHFPGSR